MLHSYHVPEYGEKVVERRPEEMAELQVRAQQSLEQPELLEPHAQLQEMRQVLRLWHEPAFHNWSSWAIFEDRPKSSDRRGAPASDLDGSTPGNLGSSP
jgi:hypothetical protein